MPVPDYPILSFKDQEKWSEWLEDNHATVAGIWIKFFKKGSNVESITYAQAVEEALCYGWIDSQAKSLDEISYLQKFTPRRSKSIWSKVNTAKIEKLIIEGKMKPAGLKQVEEAKKDGRWDSAYNSPSTIEFPQEFIKELSKNKKAQFFFDTLSKTNKYAIAWRIQTAKKEETKLRRMKLIIEKLSKGEKFH